MGHVTTVAGRELRSLFVSPVAYGVMSLFAVLAGVFFIYNVAWFNDLVVRMQQYQAFDQLEQLNLNDQLIADYYNSMSVVLLFLIPAITMPLFAAEKANGTDELLFTSPLTAWDLVLGKLVGGGLFVGRLVAIVGLFPALLFVYGDPEIGKTATGLLGLLLSGWVYVSIGAFASAIAGRSQIIAFLIAFVLLLVLLLLPAAYDLGVAAGAPWIGELFRYLSTNAHYDQLVQGLVDTGDLAYFAGTIASFTIMTKAWVESARWR